MLSASTTQAELGTLVSYVLAGYGVTFVAILGYAAWVVRRGRALTKGRGR